LKLTPFRVGFFFSFGFPCRCNPGRFFQPVLFALQGPQLQPGAPELIIVLPDFGPALP
jgi:hypothetical protein